MSDTFVKFSDIVKQQQPAWTLTAIRVFAKRGNKYDFMPTGWGNGYVILPKDHPMNGLSYSEVEERFPFISVNGGLTFAGAAEDIRADWLPENVDLYEGEWILGFDTCHWGDTPERWPDEESILEEAQRLAEQCKIPVWRN